MFNGLDQPRNALSLSLGVSQSCKVSSIYVDNGACNVLSWPAGTLVPNNLSNGEGNPKSWKGFKEKFGYTTDEEALKTKESPIEQRYKALGGSIQVIVEDKGHTHGMKDPTVILDFIRTHTEATSYSRLGWLYLPESLELALQFNGRLLHKSGCIVDEVFEGLTCIRERKTAI